MATNPTYSRRTRHIELRWYYHSDQCVNKKFNLWKVNSDVNPSEFMTKPLATSFFRDAKHNDGFAQQPYAEVITVGGWRIRNGIQIAFGK